MPGPTKPALRLMFDEARHVLEVQTEAIKTLDQKAATLLRFNVLLLGVFATGASLFARLGTPQLIQPSSPPGSLSRYLSS